MPGKPLARYCHVIMASQGLPRTLACCPELIFGLHSHTMHAMDLVFFPDVGNFAGAKVRRTNEVPPRASLLDIISAVKDISTKDASTVLARLRGAHPEITPLLHDFKFPGRGQRETPVADWPTVQRILGIALVSLLMLSMCSTHTRP